MNKKTFIFMICFVLLVGILAGCSSTSAPESSGAKTPASEQSGSPESADAQKPLTLKYATPNLPTAFNSSMHQWFGEELEKRTGGAVKTDYYWQGTLLSSADIAHGIGQGIADWGLINANDTLAEHPTWNVSNAPGLVTDLWVSSMANYEFLQNEPNVRAELDKMNLVPFGEIGGGPTYWIFDKKVSTLDDIKGLRFRTYGDTYPRIAEQLGMIPAAIIFPELYDAFDRGVVNGAMGNIATATDYKIEEVSEFWALPERNQSIRDCAICFNKDTWNNKFTEETRNIILELYPDYIDHHIQCYMDQIAQWHERIEAQGAELGAWGPDIEEKYNEAIKTVNLEMVAEVDAQGLNGTAAWNELLRCVEKWEKEFNENGYPWER